MEYYLASRAIAPGQGHEAGRALLASLYRQHTGQPLPAILRTDRGKPVFADSPWHFSITHTKAHAFCALAKAPIGIDAEELDRKIDLHLAEKILSPGEKAQWAGSPDRRLALLTFWVLKEARGKCTGAGINGWPNDTNFSLDDPRVQIKDNCLLAVVME